MGNMYSLMNSKVMQEKTTCKKSGALKHLKEDEKISEMRVDAWNVSRWKYNSADEKCTAIAIAGASWV